MNSIQSAFHWRTGPSVLTLNKPISHAKRGPKSKLTPTLAESTRYRQYGPSTAHKEKK